METKHLATLKFEADGPAVEGEWTNDSTARRTYRDWVGLYALTELTGSLSQVSLGLC